MRRSRRNSESTVLGRGSGGSLQQSGDREAELPPTARDRRRARLHGVGDREAELPPTGRDRRRTRFYGIRDREAELPPTAAVNDGLAGDVSGGFAGR
jgi:hypothetical protein